MEHNETMLYITIDEYDKSVSQGKIKLNIDSELDPEWKTLKKL